MSSEIKEGDIKESVIDKIQEIFEMSKVELEKVKCPEHGQALKDLQFDRTNGRFKFDTCCTVGNDLVEAAICKL